MRAFVLLVVSLLLLACAAPTPEANQPTPAVATAAEPQTKPYKRPPMSDPLPPVRVEDRKPVALDRSCRTDADCVVKNVGNCCGAYPSCVNKNSPTDPAGVQAQCAKDGIASVCGFNEITACRCVRNQCADEREPVGGWSDDPPPPPTDR